MKPTLFANFMNGTEREYISKNLNENKELECEIINHVKSLQSMDWEELGLNSNSSFHLLGGEESKLSYDFNLEPFQNIDFFEGWGYGPIIEFIKKMVTSNVLPNFFKSKKSFKSLEELYEFILIHEFKTDKKEIPTTVEWLMNQDNEFKEKLISFITKHGKPIKKQEAIQKTLTGDKIKLKELESKKADERKELNKIKKDILLESFKLTEWWEPTEIVLQNIEPSLHESLPPKLLGDHWIPKVCISILYLLIDHVPTYGFPIWMTEPYVSQRNIKTPEISNVYILLNRIISLISSKNNFCLPQTTIFSISSGVYDLMANYSLEKLERVQKLITTYCKKRNTQSQITDFFSKKKREKYNKKIKMQ
jgi:hypothetical protein